MENYTLLKTIRVYCKNNYNEILMFFKKKTKYIYKISFIVNLIYDSPKKILREFQSCFGNISNSDDFIVSIKIFLKKNPRWLSIEFS